MGALKCCTFSSFSHILSLTLSSVNAFNKEKMSTSCFFCSWRTSLLKLNQEKHGLKFILGLIIHFNVDSLLEDGNVILAITFNALLMLWKLS